ncbi:hypothetical protein [Streptosporangium minutum]|nr:hypothetical protein [Streptosporangium minutum]
MSSMPCPVIWCDRMMPGSVQVCGACSAGLVRDLADVPSLAHHLDLALTRQTRMGGGGRRGAETPMPWDERAREAGFILKSALVGWARMLSAGVQTLQGPLCGQACEHMTCEYASLGRGPADDMAAIARWLIWHSKALLRREAAAEAVEELTEAVRQARKAVDRPADQVYAGPCDECGSDMYARPDAVMVACPVCVDDDGQRLRYRVKDRQLWMLGAVEDLELPAPDVARALTTLVRPIAPALLYTWVSRKKLIPRTTDARGRALFRVGDVLELMDPTSVRKAS